MHTRAFLTAGFLLCTICSCTYDSTPPDASAINDSKPLVMIDAASLGALRNAELKYTDAFGTTTLSGSAQRTDSNGRLLYPLYLTRGTRSFNLVITIDVNNDGLFTSTGSDLRYTIAAGTLGSDTEIKSLRLTAADFSTF